MIDELKPAPDPAHDRRPPDHRRLGWVLAADRRHRARLSAIARPLSVILGSRHSGGTPPAPAAALSERIQMLVLLQVLLALPLLMVSLLLPGARERWLTVLLSIPALLTAGALYRLRRTRHAEGVLYLNLTVSATLLACVDPLSGTLSGATWVLFQIWPPLAALTLRRPRAAVLGAAIPLLLLLLSALLQITGTVPVLLLAPPAALLRHLGYQVLVLLVLAVALHWMSASEHRAWHAARRAQEQLQRELAQVQALAAEKAQLSALLEQRVVERSAVADRWAAELAASEERYALAARAAQDGLWDWNCLAHQIFFSARWKAMLGYGEDEIGTAPEAWYELLHPHDRPQVRARLTALMHSPVDQFELEYRIAHKDGIYRWMLCRGLAVRAASTRVVRLVGAQTDITDRKLAEARLRYNALHDSLTGLPNRALFLDRLGQAIKRGREGNTPAFALLFLDLDRFKTINDSLGHQAGDELLIGVARRLEGCLRPSDTVARLSGDEFTILLEPLIQATEATARAEQIQRALAPPFPVQGQEIFVSASIGIGLGTGEYRHADDVLRAADAALHQAKLRGKARYAVFAAPIDDQARSRLQLETDLHRAIARTELRLHYQPIVLLANDLTVGFEALVRWQHPTRGLLAPGEFLPLAEDTGLITPLSYWVLREACRQLVEWQRRLAPLPPLSISVNLPAGLLTAPELVPRIGQILRETGLAAPQLKLELVENTLVAEGEAAATALGRLKILGVQLSIDDFGTGYSSLSYLHRFPVDTIKIDRSFVSRLGTDYEHAEIIAAIVTLARSLGMTTVGEGIETAKQQQQLQTLGCDYGQGWLFAPALDAEQAASLLTGLRTTHPGAPASRGAALSPPWPPGVH